MTCFMIFGAEFCQTGMHLLSPINKSLYGSLHICLKDTCYSSHCFDKAHYVIFVTLRRNKEIIFYVFSTAIKDDTCNKSAKKNSL